MGNQFECFKSEDDIIVMPDYFVSISPRGSRFSDQADRDVIRAAYRIFNLSPRSCLSGADKEAFLTLCTDLWEEAHGKPL